MREISNKNIHRLMQASYGIFYWNFCSLQLSAGILFGRPGDPAKPLGEAVVPGPASNLVCVFCNGELRVETLSKYDVFLIMCNGCGQEMIDCDCMNLHSGRGSTRTDGWMHHRK
jgi:hypothetical protein